MKNVKAGLVLALILAVAAPITAGEFVQLASVQGYESSSNLKSAVEKTADVPDGIDAATCSAMGAVPVIVEGPAKLEFWWRGSDSGIITLYVNGHALALLEKDSGWRKFSCNIAEAGVHTIKWIFKANS